MRYIYSRVLPATADLRDKDCGAMASLRAKEVEVVRIGSGHGEKRGV